MPAQSPAPRPDDFPAWHAQTTVAVAAALGADPAAGLDAAEAAARLARHGPNQLAVAPPRPAWRKLDQFRNFLVIVLLGAAVLAGAVGDLKDALVIAIVMLLKATLAALKNMLAPIARVRRDGRVAQIPAVDLVPGDLLLLEAGDRIPADARVLHAHSAEVAEAALTGESHAVAKSPEAVPEKSAPAERRGMVFMNYVLVAVVKKRLDLDASLYTLLQILSVTLFEKMPLQQAFPAGEYIPPEGMPRKQLNLFAF